MSGQLREWRDQDLPLKTVSECKFSEQFGSYFSAGNEQAAQQFYVTASKAFRAVVRQIGNVGTKRAVHVHGLIQPNVDLPWGTGQDNREYHQSWWCSVNER